jgi:hypothetical protein
MPRTTPQNNTDRSSAHSALRRARATLTVDLAAVADAALIEGARWQSARAAVDQAEAVVKEAARRVEVAGVALDDALRRYVLRAADASGRIPRDLYVAGEGLRPGELRKLRPAEKAQRCKRWLTLVGGRADLAADADSRAAAEAAAC